MGGAIAFFAVLFGLGFLVWLVLTVAEFADKRSFDWRRLKPLVATVVVIAVALVVLKAVDQHNRDQQQREHDLRTGACQNAIIETEHRQARPGECP